MSKFLRHGFVVAAACVSVPQVAGPVGAEAASDPRTVRLKYFLAEKDCPVQHLAPDFIQAADVNELDWRLLPSISIVESSGGKFKRNNNIFGWANGIQKFPTVRHGIHTVASRLANSPRYRRKTTDQILRTYNPRPDYAVAVKQVMREIGPADLANLD